MVARARAHLPGPAAGLKEPASRRQAILHAALGLFATRGYQMTTMADIGDAVGVRAPSIYKHVASKQELLAEIMLATMDSLLAEHAAAVRTTSDVVQQLRRAVEAHARYHARHQFEAFVGNREIESLEPRNRAIVLTRRSQYEHGFRQLIERGSDEGTFAVESAQLTSYAILDMGMGVSQWFRSNGVLTVEEVAYIHGDLALRMVGVS
jgi:AcrR family transcriptional regulator